MAKSCYETDCGPDKHPKWRHAESWEEIEDALSQGYKVVDNDGDRIGGIIHEAATNEGYKVVSLFDAPEDRYTYQFQTIRISSDYKAISPEDEADALASIMQSVDARRLAK